MSTSPNTTLSHASVSTSGAATFRRLALWRRRLERRRSVQELEIEVPGAARMYRLLAPADPDAVLDEMPATEPHMPYWATPWASGLALAEVALARRNAVTGKCVLELGCGLGATATALTEAGAVVTGVDCFAESLAFARYNVLRNAGRTLRTALIDWRNTEGARALATHDESLLVAADVLYEPEDIEPLLTLAGGLLRRGGEFWLAEPGRSTSARFVERARTDGWSEETFTIEREWPAAGGSAAVRLHLFHPL